MDWINMAQDSDKVEFVDNIFLIDCGLDKINVPPWLAEKLAACEG
jgi:hypothetical protein